MTSGISEHLDKAAGLATAGYAVGLHIRFAAPTYLFRTYDAAWNEHYSASGLVMRDPVVAWGMSETGAVRWSALAGQDAAGVLREAARFGLAHGATVACLEGGSRTVAGFARSDTEFTDAELAELEALVAALHRLTMEGATLSAADQLAIQTHSVTS
ncbi:MAG: autoinducer binding domain-containing protein [Pseudomonadota bacterium]